mmetsp:Transcript_35215/g.39598  ORF Transcript_35215/g.39598 Transcript_35215/m.39598 type:complete len:81 (-) Transcript_35215:378-620(-)
MDQGEVLFYGARIFRRTFHCTVLCSETRIFCTSTEHQPHNNTTHNNKYMDQQWPFLGQIYVFLSTFFDFSGFNIMITYYG